MYASGFMGFQSSQTPLSKKTANLTTLPCDISLTTPTLYPETHPSQAAQAAAANKLRRILSSAPSVDRRMPHATACPWRTEGLIISSSCRVS